MPSEWDENSGAYIHWMDVIPFEKFPLSFALATADMEATYFIENKWKK